MIILAELNESNVCIGVKSVISMINDGKHIEIETADYEHYAFRKYENGQWSTEKFVPEYAQIELSRMERLEQSQSEQDGLLMELMLGGI
ncbi:hypothetical protein [Paenibacillus macquariensis]|uniref:Uncharacterized protein n=1 Tax=Paenibacillus macquariensis TaxID=948756 RepID=A0ABY1K735_9BACL|nr:hypothetical protein [Paenibacillus macquariensis]MEC0092512.1 hypothetical protein [Paenibacillus macquariensis]OAB35470.1 hypothetical protein PMSM_09445 [Paenibacillus macquariensis subsp. macquariensis]SIR35211.1 hypothetical protein SAMN05421578_111154 [Paenibacillus macquariensis]